MPNKISKWLSEHWFQLLSLALIPILTAGLSYYAQLQVVVLQLPAQQRLSDIETIRAASSVLSDPTSNEDMKLVAEKWLQEIRGRHSGAYNTVQSMAIHRAVLLELNDKLCWRPPNELLIRAQNLPPLVPDREDGSTSMKAMLEHWVNDISSYNQLAIRHNGLLELLEGSCGTIFDDAE